MWKIDHRNFDDLVFYESKHIKKLVNKSKANCYVCSWAADARTVWMTDVLADALFALGTYCGLIISDKTTTAKTVLGLLSV